jgi:tetratricopeptide (TPR) repeat protein
MSAVMPDAQAGPLLSSLSIMSLELRAAILAEQKRLPEAKALFVQAAQEEKNLGYREPPTYIRPVGETEGFALLRAGDYSGAHKAYEAAQLERPKSGFPLFGMARSSEAAGDGATAGKEYAEFADAWKNGNPDLPQMAHAREYMAAQKVQSTATK